MRYTETVNEIHAHLSNIQHTLSAIQKRETNSAKPTREEVWVRCWVVATSSDGIKTTEVATEWADAGLAAFDKKFGTKP